MYLDAHKEMGHKILRDINSKDQEGNGYGLLPLQQKMYVVIQKIMASTLIMTEV